jgi:hypothetical protein
MPPQEDRLTATSDDGPAGVPLRWSCRPLLGQVDPKPIRKKANPPRTLPIASAGRHVVERSESGASGVGLRNSDLWSGMLHRVAGALILTGYGLFDLRRLGALRWAMP